MKEAEERFEQILELAERLENRKSDLQAVCRCGRRISGKYHRDGSRFGSAPPSHHGRGDSPG